jgi:hypothetical protein
VILGSKEGRINSDGGRVCLNESKVNQKDTKSSLSPPTPVSSLVEAAGLGRVGDGDGLVPGTLESVDIEDGDHPGL